MISRISPAAGGRNSDPPAQDQSVYTIPIRVLGMGLSVFLAISYIVCVLGYLLVPSLPVEHSALAIFLPGFTLISWQSFFLGLAESFVWGWYIALVFGSIYNFFASRLA